MEMFGFRQMMHDRNPPLCKSAFVGMLFSVISGRLILNDAAKDAAGVISVGLISSASSSSRNADTFREAVDCCGSQTERLPSPSSSSSRNADTFMGAVDCCGSQSSQSLDNSNSISSVDNTVQTLEFVVRKFGQ